MSAPAAPKVKKTTKAKAPAAHPPYNKMIVDAIKALKERGGSSKIAILKYIMKNYNVGNDEKKVNSRVKIALRRGCETKTLKHAKGGVGATGSFMVGDKKVAEKKPAKPKKAKTPKKAKKPAAAKPKKAKSPAKKAKAAPKKAKAPKKAASPKKTKKPKTPKKTAKKAAKK